MEHSPSRHTDLRHRSRHRYTPKRAMTLYRSSRRRRFIIRHGAKLTATATAIGLAATCAAALIIPWR